MTDMPLPFILIATTAQDAYRYARDNRLRRSEYVILTPYRADRVHNVCAQGVYVTSRASTELTQRTLDHLTALADQCVNRHPSRFLSRPTSRDLGAPTAFATRADELPDGLCYVFASGDFPGGIAWKRDGYINGADRAWAIGPAAELERHNGIPMVAVPEGTARNSEDERVRAWALNHINQHTKEA